MGSVAIGTVSLLENYGEPSFFFFLLLFPSFVSSPPLFLSSFLLQISTLYRETARSLFKKKFERSIIISIISILQH